MKRCLLSVFKPYGGCKASVEKLEARDARLVEVPTEMLRGSGD